MLAGGEQLQGGSKPFLVVASGVGFLIGVLNFTPPAYCYKSIERRRRLL